MGYVAVNINNIVEHLSEKMEFLQPVYEAITNSLEANAKNITVEFFQQQAFDDQFSRITGFKIIDDGDGFTPKNVKAFCELWTKNKVKLGCKGSGRFTWLKVFNDIKIVSQTALEQRQVIIPFNVDFDSTESISISEVKCDTNKTEIIFTNVSSAYYDTTKQKIVDKRAIADLKEIKKSIVDYLLIKFFLLKRKAVPFSITLSLNQRLETIDYSDIPDLKSSEFDIPSSITNSTYHFILYYNFTTDGKNSKKVIYCANARATKVMDDDALGFSCALPNNDSFIMLLCSEYFDDKDNDSRDDLSALNFQKSQSIDIPLLYSDINPFMKKAMKDIIDSKYPELSQYNLIEEQKAIETTPYLSKYIKENDDIVKSSASLITSAEKSFATAKRNAQRQFAQLLSKKNINQDEFNNSVNELSLIAAAELGEYILYRESIIKALDSVIDDSTKRENFIHNIFMPMKTVSVVSDENKHLISNLWLLDDKFMTYIYAASDRSVENIKDGIAEKRYPSGKTRKRPDLFIFFNTLNGHKNIVVIEFKGANADNDEKVKSLYELPDNLDVIKKNIDDIEETWSYIITSIDDDFRNTIINQEVFTPLFTSNDSLPMYYRQFAGKKAHLFIIDIKTITGQAFARNKIFLDILKKSN